MTLVIQRSPNGVSGWSDITGTTDVATYINQSADLNYYLRVKETRGGVVAYSAVFGPITNPTSGLQFGMYNNCAVSGSDADTAANWKAVRDNYMPSPVQWRREFNSGLPASYNGGDVALGIKTFLSFKSPFANVLDGSAKTAIQNYVNTWPTGCYATWEHEPEAPSKEFAVDPHNNYVIPIQTIYGWVKQVRPDVQFGPVHMAYQWSGGGTADPGVGNATRWVVDPAFADFYGVDWYNQEFNPVNWNLSNATDFQNWYNTFSPKAKPLWISEYGIKGATSSAGGKNDANTVTVINASRTWADSHPLLAGVLYWNGVNSDGGVNDFQITPSISDPTGRPSSLVAWNNWVLGQ